MDIDDILSDREYLNLNNHLKELMRETVGDDLVDRLNDEFFRKFFTFFKNEATTLDWYFTNNPEFNNHRPYDVCNAGRHEMIHKYLTELEASIVDSTY